MIFGWGVLKGMGVTFKNFLTSYFRKPDEGGIFTVQYPEVREKEIENFRNFPFLVYDGSPDKIRCVACGICERECPPKCIHIEMALDAAGKPTRKPALFDIDYGLCMNCGICEEVCPFDSIFMDHAFEVTAVPIPINRSKAEIGAVQTTIMEKKEKVWTPERSVGLVQPKEALAKSSEYFQKIRPVFASIIDQKRKAAEEKKKAATQPPLSQEPK